MNPEDPNLKDRVIARQQEKGPATLETLALELSAPQWDVHSLLEKLRAENSVRLLFGGLWDVHWKPPAQNSGADEGNQG